MIKCRIYAVHAVGWREIFVDKIKLTTTVNSMRKLAA